MELKIYNSLTRTKETFRPREEGRVGIYVCGITAYDSCHIGHARSAVVFDVMVRYLRSLGFEVTYVKNFTDIDDKIIDKAKRLGQSVSDISECYMAEHDAEMDRLGIIRPTYAPRATEHIAGMIGFISILMEKGLAYEMEGDIYYSVEKFRGYGKLSGRSLADMTAGARVEVNEKKRNPLDFVLWKASKEGEPWWDSPWGPGRPGWHIECSAMSQEYLGATFDIHGGGEDLVFPHHENEIAQSEGVTGEPPAKYWVHNGFVRVNREKMSKSLGNICNIRDILRDYHPEVVRLFFLQSHYRSPVDFSDESLVEARHGLNRLYSALEAIDTFLKRTPSGEGKKGGENILAQKHAEVVSGFNEAMNDDFNTARAIGQAFDLARAVNAFVSDKTSLPTPSVSAVLNEVREFFHKVASVLGLLQEDPTSYLLRERDGMAERRGLNIAEIERLIQERAVARQEKKWSRADEIRRILAERGVVLQDVPQGTNWMME